MTTQAAETSQARRFKLAGPYSYATARRLEREALATENPRYGMTSTQRGQHTRNAHLQRTVGIEYAHRVAPVEAWSGR